jgi:hypothetical protein
VMGSPEIYELVTEAVLHEALRVHVARESLFPDYADNLEPIKRAIVLCARGRGDAYVVFGHRDNRRADVLVAAVGLEPFVYARMAGQAYLN